MTDTKKPFLCNQPGCGMSFTNEDHLTVHKKKHDISLSLSGKHAYIADQTPTPTRFIRYGEEVGLFQDLQNVNPFEEQFKKATESVKMGEAPLQSEPMSGPVDDALHTPQVFSIIRSRTPIVNTEPEVHPEIIIDTMLPHPPVLPDEMRNVPKSSENAAQPPSDQSKKFLPVIQLPNGQYISLTGEPVQQSIPSSIPSVVIPSTYVNTGSVTIEKVPTMNQIVQHKMVPPEPVAGSSKYYILPKPGISPMPRKMSLAKEKLKEKVTKNKIVQPIIGFNPLSAKLMKRPKLEQSLNPEGNKVCKDEMKLERNRAAAARFRKKKKHLESNLVLKVRDLEDRVKELQSENKRITNQMLYYRAESVKTKDLLLAHRDCSVTREMNKSEVIAVVDSSTHLTLTRRQVKSSKSRATQVPITVRRASVSKAPSLTPLVIVRQTSGDGNGVLRFGGSSDSVIVENIQRPCTD